MKALLIFTLLSLSFVTTNSYAEVDSISGLYSTILYHEDGDYYQHAKITLRTVNPNGVMKISANIRIFFGEADSTEYLTYEFSEVPLNLLTRQISIVNEDNEVSMIGFLRNGKIEGEWFSTLVGRVGRFEAQKGSYPDIKEGKILVESLSGFYKGKLENISTDSNLPERISISFVSSQDTSEGKPTLHISGNIRLYLGAFGSQEYVETEFKDIQYNVYNRFLSAKTKEYGLTLKGYIRNDGLFKAEVFSDGLGEVATIEVNKE